MIRFLTFLLNKPYETCKSCQTLKEQLDFERAEKKELLNTLMRIVNPKVYEAPAQELNPVIQTSGLFSRRRAALEARDKEAARVLRDSANIGRPDVLTEVEPITTEKLEEELGIDEEQKEKEA